MKIISYSLFGFNKERNENCFDFYSYLRGLMIQIRFKRLIYPDWEIRLFIDENSYTPFKSFFDSLPIQIRIMPNDIPLCKAMLWRIIPAFDNTIDALLCRDLDSPLTYRESQCVQYWLNRESKVFHAITDSVSHNIPLMGGMIGIKPKYFNDSFKTDWETLVNLGGNYDKKGSDQDFLNRIVYPKFAQQGNDSIVQHYILGMPNTFLREYHNTVPDLELKDVPIAMKESNDCCGHIGASGWYSTATTKFITKYKDSFLDLIEIEKEYSDIFSWVKNGCY